VSVLQVHHDASSYTILPIHEHQLCFILHPKAANTSIKLMIRKAQGYTEINNRLLNWQWDFLRPCEIPQDYYTVTVVRNPIERVKSLYADKFGHPGKVAKYLKEIGYRADMGFENYITLLCNQSDRVIEKHLRQQTFSLYCDGKCVADKIYKLETIDWAKFKLDIFEKTGFELCDIEYENPSDKQTKAQVENLITPEIRQRLEIRYKDDLELLEYNL